MFWPKLGSNRAQNTANILSGFLMFLGFFIIIISFFWGLNYSQMANFYSRTYSNTFCMISGTSKKSTKSGPSDPVCITKTLQQIQDIILEHPWKYYFHIWELEILNVFEGLCTNPFEKLHFCFETNNKLEINMGNDMLGIDICKLYCSREFKALTIANLKLWYFETLEFWNFDFWNI